MTLDLEQRVEALEALLRHPPGHRRRHGADAELRFGPRPESAPKIVTPWRYAAE